MTTMKPIDLPICEFCDNTGVHICPDFTDPVVVACSHKNCPITRLLNIVSEMFDLLISVKSNQGVDQGIALLCWENDIDKLLENYTTFLGEINDKHTDDEA